RSREHGDAPRTLQHANALAVGHIPNASSVACRACFRISHYADDLHLIPSPPAESFADRILVSIEKPRHCLIDDGDRRSFVVISLGEIAAREQQKAGGTEEIRCDRKVPQNEPALWWQTFKRSLFTRTAAVAAFENASVGYARRFDARQRGHVF